MSAASASIATPELNAAAAPASSSSTSSAAAAGEAADIAYLRSLVTSHKDFPIPGIEFKDIFPIMRVPRAARMLVTRLVASVQARWCTGVDVVIGLDSRGFLFGPQIADSLDCSFVPIRKQGKLPGECVANTYKTEYSEATSEIQRAAIQPGQRVVLVDDLLATGGTLTSAAQLVRACGGVVLGAIVVIELPDCAGRQRLVKEAGLASDDLLSLMLM